MPEYFIFKKGSAVHARSAADIDAASALKEQGYEKQFEEIIASDEKSALARFASIKKEEQLTVHAFMTGPAIISLALVIMVVIGFVLT
ncbi:hypothetical protein [Lelliottia amnigena]|uniref:Uncharacterized protein n=1 Tax=Lelliottia amnigena TaxID=61646 RepID=A0AAP2F023_LELAM|nr:hypothetical protein [Lelliottia amnigena]MBL5899452.1 hypothetical protein [Lelliottia amnigena]MBL5934966.1 hypothetical protein [Lelliottia amnigena]MCU7784041.1 hypothetical protein [Lelliottia amnigena]